MSKKVIKKEIKEKYQNLLESYDILGKIKKHGIYNFANNLNKYIDYKWFKETWYKDEIPKQGSAESRSGRFVEELVLFLFKIWIKDHKIENWNAYHQTELSEDEKKIFSIIHRKKKITKYFDVDIFITNDKKEKWYLLSIKGSVRERIGQFIATLFLLDEKVIKEKYQDQWYLNHVEKQKDIKYGLINLDWSGEVKDFQKFTKKGKKRNSVKEVEIELINDDTNIGGKVTALNNFTNFEHVINFAGLCAEISKFFDRE